MFRPKHQSTAKFESAQAPSYLRHNVSPIVNESENNNSGRSTPDLSHPFEPRTAGDGAETTEITQTSDSSSTVKTTLTEKNGSSSIQDTSKKIHGAINQSIAAKFSKVGCLNL